MYSCVLLCGFTIRHARAELREFIVTLIFLAESESGRHGSSHIMDIKEEQKKGSVSKVTLVKSISREVKVRFFHLRKLFDPKPKQSQQPGKYRKEPIRTGSEITRTA